MDPYSFILLAHILAFSFHDSHLLFFLVGFLISSEDSKKILKVSEQKDSLLRGEWESECQGASPGCTAHWKTTAEEGLVKWEFSVQPSLWRKKKTFGTFLHFKGVGLPATQSEAGDPTWRLGGSIHRKKEKFPVHEELIGKQQSHGKKSEFPAHGELFCAFLADGQEFRHNW